MVIDLSRFVNKKEETVVPIVGGVGKIGARKVVLEAQEDGWYLVNLQNTPKLIRKATLLEIEQALSTRKTWRVYALGNEGIPANFDHFSKAGLAEAIDVNFLSLPAFEVVKVVLWDDGRFYFYEADAVFNRGLLNQIKESFEKDRAIDRIKGLTPELRYYFLLLDLQRQSYRTFQEMEKFKISQREREKRVLEFQNSFAGRLQKTIENAGGKLVKFYKFRSGWMVHWKLNRTLIKTTIRDNMRIINAGFCLSSQDQKHSIASLVVLAKTFQESAPLYLTRE